MMTISFQMSSLNNSLLRPYKDHLFGLDSNVKRGERIRFVEEYLAKYLEEKLSEEEKIQNLHIVIGYHTPVVFEKEDFHKYLILGHYSVFGDNEIHKKIWRLVKEAFNKISCN